eukprot:PhM_4_TR461/c3_g3_i4/m.80152
MATLYSTIADNIRAYLTQIAGPYIRGSLSISGRVLAPCDDMVQLPNVLQEMEDFDKNVRNDTPWGIAYACVGFNQIAFFEPKDYGAYVTNTWSPKEYRVAGAVLDDLSFHGHIDVVTFSNDNVMIVAFRGTQVSGKEGIGDWISDVVVVNTKNGGLGVPATGGKSHYTFQHGVDELMAGQLGQDLKQFSKKHGDRAKILITGHSQGAGLAVLAHLTVLKEKVLSGYIGCVAIATPKVLDFEGSANGECALEDFNKTVRMGKPPAHAIQKKNLPRRGFTSLFYVEFILAAWEKHWRRHLRYRKTVFMEDNAPVHKTKEVRRTFAKFHQMNMRLSGLSLTLSDGSTVTLHWPPNSPDLNPIENLWRLVKHEVRRNNVTSLKKTQEAAT